jgi:hypothetical protein
MRLAIKTTKAIKTIKALKATKIKNRRTSARQRPSRPRLSWLPRNLTPRKEARVSRRREIVNLPFHSAASSWCAAVNSGALSAAHFLMPSLADFRDARFLLPVHSCVG